MDYYFVSYGLTIIALIITLDAQAFVSSSYSKYSKVKNTRGITGKDAARYLLDKHGLSNIQVVETNGYLTDHYDPTNKVIKLSKNVYRDSTNASVSVAAHECGHAIQDKENYMFLRIRSALVPIVNFSSNAGYFAILLGCIFGSAYDVRVLMDATSGLMDGRKITDMQLPLVEKVALKKAIEKTKGTIIEDLLKENHFI